MRPTRTRPTRTQVLVSLTLLAINIAAIVVAVGRYREVASTRGEGSRANYAEYAHFSDGSLWKSRVDTATGSRTKSVQIRPPTLPGLVGVWWPIAAGLGLSLAALGVALVRGRAGARAGILAAGPVATTMPRPD